MAELSGSYTYRSFNPTYVMGDQTPQGERGLIRAGDPHPLALTLKMAADPVGVEGTIGWQGGGLDLNGTVVSGERSRFDIVGTGRPRTDTAGWEYRYHGHLSRHWPEGVDQHQTLVGSVIRITPHNGQPGRWLSPAGEVFSFIAVKQSLTAPLGLYDSWTYRSFHNNPTPVYYPTAPQTAHLILQEAIFKLATIPGSRGPLGTIELPGGGVLDISSSTLRPAEGGEQFSFAGIGRRDTKAFGWEYFYDGHQTRHWPEGVDQRAALVGNVIIHAKPHGEAAPVGSVYPFIAVKQ